jgi:eukaryotic-like serine/threonine-protein kinase
MPPRERDPAYPEGLERVLLKALEKDPNQRYQTAEELRDALVEYLSSTGRFFTDKHVAEVLNGALGSQLSERNRAVFASAERLRRGELTEPLQSPHSPRAHETLTPEGGVERSVTALHQGSNSKVIRVAAIAGAGLALLLAIGFFRASSAPHVAPEPAAPTTPVVASPTPGPTLAAPTSEAVSTPTAPSGTSLSFPAPSMTAPAALPRPLRPHTAPVTAPVVAATPSEAVPVKPSGKAPRPIDRSNPFAQPAP